MLGKRIINTGAAGAACTTDTVQILGDTSCVAYYKMSDATDETGSYDGTPTNVNFNVAGKFGNAGEFNGTSSKINTGYIQTGQIYSASFWGKGFSAGGSILRDTPAAGGANTFMDIATGANGQPVLAGNAALDPLNTPSADWTHYVFVLDGTNATIFTNGSQTATRTYTAKTGNNGTPVHIMSNGAYPAGFASGSIDQVRIFDRAITANEVTTLYNEVECIPTIVPTDNFNTVLYTANGGTLPVTTVGFQPDLVWVKSRVDTQQHLLTDSVRGVGNGLISNLTLSEAGVSSNANGKVQSFDIDGFTVNIGTNNFPANNYTNDTSNGGDYVSWNWKAGGDDVLNQEGSINSQVSANTDAGFSVVKYTGNLTASTVGHGLSSTPELIIVKRTDSTSNWFVYSAPTGNTKYLNLDATGAASTFNVWNNTSPTDAVFSLAAQGDVNASGGSYISYAFHSVDGMSKIGSYVGNGGTNSIVTGFRPAFVMIKGAVTPNTTNWWIFDNKRNPDNPLGKGLLPNSSSAEQAQGTYLDFNSNGFTWLSGNGEFNDSGNTFIYMAFAEENVEPQPELANSFNTVTYTGNGGTQAINTVGFQPDLVWIKNRDYSSGIGHQIFDSVRGDTQGSGGSLSSNSTAAEYFDGTKGVKSFDVNGFTVDGGANGQYGVNGASGGTYGSSYVAWCWKASNESTINNDGSISSVVSANPASGFSVAKYTGNSQSGPTVGHGLGSKPDLILIKNLSAAQDWAVYSSPTTANKYLMLNKTNGAIDYQHMFNDTEPDSSVFTLGYQGKVNQSGNQYVAYCFSSITNYQKVGSYSGSGGAGNAQDVGFAPDFLMVKSTNATTNWAIFDTARTGKRLQADLSNAEGDDTRVTLTSTGFQFTGAAFNETGRDWIYLAIKAN